MADKNSGRKIDVTVYGATSFVARHVIHYLMQVSVTSLPADRGTLAVTLAGRNRSKLEALRDEYSKKASNLRTMNPDATGQCSFGDDVCVADSDDVDALCRMAEQTKMVLNCAGPFSKYGTNVVAACAKAGTDYVDITGEISWAGAMREKYGETAKKSGARIISFCGFDSVPSDLAVFVAVEALKEGSTGKSVDIQKATTWHCCLGGVNGGTVHTVLDMRIDPSKLLRPVPYLMDDPLVLAHPKVRNDPSIESTRKRLAVAEWVNQLPSVDSIFKMGVSIPFFMAPVNAKVVNATALSLKYGRNFVYRERFIPTSYAMTTNLTLVSAIPAILVQLVTIVAVTLLKLPIIGLFLANLFFPPGTGMSDSACREGYAHVYAEVATEANSAGGSDKASCLMKFKGDPGNFVTAQCVSEAALTLLFGGDDLPPRSSDGFGTPAELLGKPLVQRLLNSPIRAVTIETDVRKGVGREWRMFPEAYPEGR